jgi:FG-GAP-like repeat
MANTKAISVVSTLNSIFCQGMFSAMPQQITHPFVALLFVFSSLLISLPVHADSTPVVKYTDAISGPTSGGEFNAGAYLSVFGSNFGSASGLGTNTKVFIGGVEVANYRYLGAAKVGAKLGLQQLAVQVGGLGNAAQGKALPITVKVNGIASNSDHTFMPNPGRILYVAQNGNDAAAVAGDITKPWRYLQTSSAGGAHGVMRAGDHVVIRGGNWTDTGLDGAWLRFRYPEQQGRAPTGVAGTGWIHITAYPGPVGGNAFEDVHYSTPAGVKGGIHGANSAYFATTGDWVSISNLRMDVNAQATSDAAPINLQYSAGPWRVVNNELGPWPSILPAPNNSKGAGVSGHGDSVKVLGNHIYGMACVGALENHGIYADSGASNWEISYNWIHDITGGNLIQFFDNVGLAGNVYAGFPASWPGFTGMQIHHNWLENSGKYGLNMADGIVSAAIWNNVILRATYAGLRVNTISKNMDMVIAFNTFYDNDRVASGSGNAQVLNTWGNYNPTGIIRIYNNILAAGPGTIRGSSYYENAGSADGYLDFKRNLYWDNGYGWGTFARDASAVLGDPKFVAPTASNFNLNASSVAVDKGTQTTALNIVDDFAGQRRPSGIANDLGAFERLQAAILLSPGDLSADGKSDLIFRNGSTGQINAWLMNGTTSTAAAAFVGAGNWTVTHSADFNGDGRADILYRNDDGSVSLWLMNGLAVAGSAGLLGPDANWRVSHVGDFNGDGRADILWRHSNGAVNLWLMDGTTVSAALALLGPNPDWRVSHIGDFDGDGKTDILWRNTNGAVNLWLMNGGTVTSAVGLLGANPDWQVSHLGDFNGDGKTDILWRNTNGAVNLWLMNGGTVTSAVGLLAANPDWQVSHTADFNGDGKADLLWRSSNGAVTQWLMNGTAIAGTAGLLGPDPNWRVTHIGDYNGDGKADLVWRNASDGAITMWLMNGATTLSAAGILGATTWGVVPVQ